jgi:hypothetical protein
MSDDDRPVERISPGPRSQAHRPSPSAQAASRARRIGGRPQPGPRPGPDPVEATDAGTDRPTRPAGVTTAERPPAHAAADDADLGAELVRRLNRLRWIPAGVAGVLAVALAATVLFFSHGVWWAKPAAPDYRNQVLAAAKSCMPSVGSYDYRNLKKSTAAGLACSTGTFKSNYQQAMDTVVQALAPQSKTIQTVSVTEAGIISTSADGTQWVVLIYGQQKVQNDTTAKAQPRYDTVTVVVTMDRVGKAWLISAEKLANGTTS